MNRMAFIKAGVLSVTAPALLATWLAAEAATERPRDNLPSKLKSDLPNAKTVNVSFRDGLLSVEAKAGTWRQVLSRITERTGILFHHALPLEESVTVSFANLPVRQAIERLFGPEPDFVFRYDAKPNSLAPLTKEVWIFGKAVSNNKALIPVQAEQQAMDKPSGNAVIARTELDRLMEMTKSSNAATRVEALSILKESGMGDQEEIRGVLAAALTEQDPMVRNLVVKAIASEGGAEAVSQLARVLHDPDLSVRIAAIESMPLENGGSALLQEALADPDGVVRSCAQNRLQEAKRQGATNRSHGL
jgi:HEAT repeats